MSLKSATLIALIGIMISLGVDILVFFVIYRGWWYGLIGKFIMLVSIIPFFVVLYLKQK